MKNCRLLREGKGGQLQEWFLDYPEVDVHHRHVSQLYGLYPGNLIHREDEELLAACRVALDRRGDEGTGWCMAWKACLWARLGDGERALKLLKNQLHVTREENCSLVGGGTYPNMLCAHPPFQIDGNFGFAAAVLEMLVQYQDDRILFLPALPKEWKDGKIRGLKAPGGITIDFAWKDEQDHGMQSEIANRYGAYTFVQRNRKGDHAESRSRFTGEIVSRIPKGKFPYIF